jgi:hypothetical protein
MGLLFLLLLAPGEPRAQKFLSDDPLSAEPRSAPVEKVASTALGETSDFIQHSLHKIGERHTTDRLIRAQGTNTLDEVPNSAWYTNRHYRQPMSLAELTRGPDRDGPPAKDGLWKVVAAKTEGISLGFTIEDARGRKYLLKFDPHGNPEMATAADVITTKFFYALGYNVPENYIVYFEREQLTTVEPEDSEEPSVTESQIAHILKRVPHDDVRGYRAMASRFVSGEIIGPFQYHGTRQDDPNDIVPHEHRRELRGLSVFAAWLNHTDAKSLNTLDTVVEEDGIRYVKHYLVDFGSALGSGADEAKRAWVGHQYAVEWKPGAVQAATLGLYVPEWARADYPKLPSVGRLEWEVFEPEKWKSNYPVPAFENRLPDDAFWAAKQVMAFTDKQIRAIVKTGEYSDPNAEQWVADSLIARRDKIARAYFSTVLPLDSFAIEDGRLVFEDLGEKYDLLPRRTYAVAWSAFDNHSETKQALAGETSFALPRWLTETAKDVYATAEIRGDSPGQTITVYLRKRSGSIDVVGVERAWAQT